MANLKLDLLNKIQNDKYFEEMELVRLAQDPNINYREKIDAMSYRLQSIAIINAQLGLVEQYFNEQAPQQAAPQGQVHQGQSHGE
jgi:hypothetical protein